MVSATMLEPPTLAALASLSMIWVMGPGRLISGREATTSADTKTLYASARAWAGWARERSPMASAVLSSVWVLTMSFQSDSQRVASASFTLGVRSTTARLFPERNLLSVSLSRSPPSSAPMNASRSEP